MIDQHAQERVKSFVERVINLESEKKDIQEQIKEVYLEAKNEGHDVKGLREAVKLAKLPDEERKHREAIRDTYIHAAGLE